MEVKQAEFIISAAVSGQYPKDGFPEIAFVGKSNVGKSSLINTLTNRKSLAKVSGTPGKTKLVNFFLINKLIYFVDLPGYGYAKVSKEEQKNWGQMIESYLKGSKALKKFVLLVDSRHKPTKDDILMYNWIKEYNIECIIVSTKIDKLSNNEIYKSDKIIKETLQIGNYKKFLHFSSLKRTGKEELLDAIFDGINN